jgi:ADP-ribose pyrophosphatase YjhB (NUDIX family)
MIIDAALQREITARFIAGGFGDVPRHAVHHLGHVTLPGAGAVALHLRHAADAILLDDFGQVVLITRLHQPGAGLLALPGGFIDEVDSRVESPLDAAIREAVGEAGVDERLLREVSGVPVGRRLYDRPFDIRVAWNNLPGTSIRQGDVFGVSTQGFCFRLHGNLRTLPLQAGDDAKAVQVAEITQLKAGALAVPDHLTLIHLAREMAGMGRI